MGLVLLLSLLSFESALHSAHHGLDEDQARSCELASGVAQADAMPVEPVVSAALPGPAAAPLPDGHHERPAAAAPRSDRQRAPPLPSS